VVATQVKEKLGILRFRVQSSNEYQRSLIDFAERLSIHICTICGKQAQIPFEQRSVAGPRCESCRSATA
jgi:hypothetical protein